jgi:hypothetical protein
MFQTKLLSSEDGKEGQAAFLVRGRVTTVRPGQLVVNAGGRIVNITTGEALSLTCKLSGWDFASVGDSIRGKVEHVPQPNTGITSVTVRELTIRAATPLKPAAAKAGPAKSTATPSGNAKP